MESVEAAQPAPAPESSPSSPRKPPKRKTSDLSFPIESKRPKSPTLLLACKHVGTSRDALVQREPEDAHTLPSDVLCMRKEHQERRVQYLVELARRKYWELTRCRPGGRERSRGARPFDLRFLHCVS